MKKPIISKDEKKTLSAARRILKKLTAMYEDLCRQAFDGGEAEELKLDDFLVEVAKSHIDFYDDAFISLKF